MNAAGAQRVSLLAHPDAGAEFVRSVAAEAQLTAGAQLSCRCVPPLLIGVRLGIDEDLTSGV